MVVLFSYGKVKDMDVFLIRIKFHLGRTKGKGYGGGSQIRVIFAKFPLLSKIQTLSHKTFGQTNFYHCNRHAKKLYAGIFK